MSTRNRYDESFKRTIVELYHNGKTQASLVKEYGISQTALTKWIKQYSTVETENGEVLPAKQVRELLHAHETRMPWQGEIPKPGQTSPYLL